MLAKFNMKERYRGVLRGVAPPCMAELVTCVFLGKTVGEAPTVNILQKEEKCTE